MARVNTSFVQEAPTRIQGSHFALDAQQSRTFKGGPVGFHRKEFIITNDDNSSTRAYVSAATQEAANASAQVRLGCVFDSGTLHLATNADIIVFNPTSSVLTNLHVAEIFYTGAGALVV